MHKRSRLYSTIPIVLMLAALILSACSTPRVQGSSVPEKVEAVPKAATFQVSDGPEAPDWSLETLEGDTFQLADHKGEVVVMFFMASWCSSCVLEARALAQLHETYADQGLTIVAINVEPQKNVDGVIRFRQVSNDAPYSWVFDDKFVVSQLYGVKSLDTTIVIDRAGKIAYTDSFVSPYDTLEKAVKDWL